MKKLKLFLIGILAFALLGCLDGTSPSETVENFMNKYINNDISLMDDLDRYADKQNISESQKKWYKEIIKKEYSDIKYTIKEEELDGDEAEVTLDIEVKDLYKSAKESDKYIKEHSDEFKTSDDRVEYKLKKMEESQDTIKYTIEINLKNIDGIWTIESLDKETVEKIHGIYNYDLN